MSPEIIETNLSGLKVVKTPIFNDGRGYFSEIFNGEIWRETGLDVSIKQVNQSGSKFGVIRGLHFQWNPPMGKLMRVVSGRALLVAVDVRYKSPTLGKWFGIDVSAEDHTQLWGEAGFARGFCALSELTEIQYLCTANYNPKGEFCILWSDPDIGISWPVTNPILSEKDATAPSFAQWLARAEARHIC